MMTKDKLYDMVLEDWLNGDIYEPLSLIKDLIQLLEPEAVEQIAQTYEYDPNRAMAMLISKRLDI